MKRGLERRAILSPRALHNNLVIALTVLPRVGDEKSARILVSTIPYSYLFVVATVWCMVARNC
eukprot:scaffold261_cov170-Amphora_coffeaeformis.AAC.15